MFASIILGVLSFSTTVERLTPDPVLREFNRAALSVADFQFKREKLGAELIPKLVELAKKANSLKGFASRDRCYRVILSLDFEHNGARRGLKSRKVDGVWVAPPPKRPAKDATSRRVTKLAAELDEHVTGYLNAMVPLIAEHGIELGPEGIDDAYRRVLLADPDNGEIRALIGESKLGDRWVMIETAKSVERRGSLLTIARNAYEAVGRLETVEAEGFELQTGMPWSVGYQTSRVRCFGTGGAGEVEQILRASHAMGDLIEAALGRPIALARDHAIYSLASEAEKAPFLKSLPRARKETSNVLAAANGGWLGHGNRFGVWSEDVPRRVDGATRATVNQYLQNGFKISLRHGWASEGIGLYLVETMVGTHLTWFTKVERYIIQNDGGKATMSIENPDLDWMQAGRELLTSADAPHLGLLLGRRVSTMSSLDLIHAYVLAAYLIEGRSQELPLLLETIGKNGNPTKAFELILGEKLPVIEMRLRDWVVQRAEFEESLKAAED
ncbi:MAG: hypothetical protein ACI8TQ_003256 [Planctomycetota bacterium]